MRLKLGVALATITLAACGGTSPEAQLRSDCAVIVTDPEGQDLLESIKANEESFCVCLNTNVSALPETEQDKVRASLSYVAEQAKETGRQVEDIATDIMRGAMLSPDDEEMQKVLEGMPLAGNLFDDVERDLETGVCSRVG